MHDSLHLRSNVTVRGRKGKSILRKAGAAISRLTLDGDFGEQQFTVADASGFAVGAGVAIWDDKAQGFHTTVARITGRRGNTFSIDIPLIADCMVANHATAATVFPVVSGSKIQGARVEDLVIEGNKGANPPLNGCRGAGIYLNRAFGTADTKTRITCSAATVSPAMAQTAYSSATSPRGCLPTATAWRRTSSRTMAASRAPQESASGEYRRGWSSKTMSSAIRDQVRNKLSRSGSSSKRGLDLSRSDRTRSRRARPSRTIAGANDNPANLLIDPRFRTHSQHHVRPAYVDEEGLRSALETFGQCLVRGQMLFGVRRLAAAVIAVRSGSKLPALHVNFQLRDPTGAVDSRTKCGRYDQTFKVLR